MALGQEESVKQQIQDLKSSLTAILESEETYERASNSQKMKIVQDVQRQVNKGKTDIRNLEFEVNMLPLNMREEPKQKLKKINNQYEECRRLYFKLEDDLNTNVLRTQKTGRQQ